jgi:L-2-hydroxyglutarate oxidase
MKSDYLIIGGGIMGLTIARTLKERYPEASITIIEKEGHVAEHASGRNSGVLHAGFYYSPDSMKAKFCRDGNQKMRAFVKEHGLAINECGKVVVARNEKELVELHKLLERGKANGVELELIDEKQLAVLEPNAKTHKYAIWSPTTAVVDPQAVCNAMRDDLLAQGVKILTNTPFEMRAGGNTIIAGGEEYEGGKIINCAGAHSAKIAKKFGFCKDYSMVPFKGVYVTCTNDQKPIKRCLYGVPNPKNPFLGVHYSVTVDGRFRLGPTAMPVLGPEQYKWSDSVDKEGAFEIADNLRKMAKHSHIRGHAVEELLKSFSGYLVHKAKKLVQPGALDNCEFDWDREGIRAQLMDDLTQNLEHDFVVQGDKDTVHVLNAVSPSFTSSIPFAEWIVENCIEKAEFPPRKIPKEKPVEVPIIPQSRIR